MRTRKDAHEKRGYACEREKMRGGERLHEDPCSRLSLKCTSIARSFVLALERSRMHVDS
jgi:hypothetical protein